MSEVQGRVAVNAEGTRSSPTAWRAPVQPEMSWLPVSYDARPGVDCYLMRVQPGAVTIAHDHAGMEEFLVLEGDPVDSDGDRAHEGGFVSYQPGTHHNSWTEGGCLLAVFEWRREGAAT